MNDTSAAIKTRPADFLTTARRVLRIEAEALSALQQRIDLDFSNACQLMLDCKGRVVCTGMGKSGHIARKIAATLASTGTPAFFLHPGEASHGDLGMVTEGDVVLMLSNSGESDEIRAIIPALKRQGNRLIALTGRKESSMAKLADVHVDVSVPAEACPLDLAPTSSTTAVLALGDAFAVALMEARGFTSEDFARSHPAGSLGRKLLLRIEDVMHAGHEVPRVPPTASVREALVEMSRTRLGMTAIVDESDVLLGVFTDGDLRRALDDAAVDIRNTPVSRLMGKHPKTVSAHALAVEAAQLMQEHKINALVVVDEQKRVRGALNFHDLLRARVM
jgi:arabinose-5-phosphate isomerase